MKVVFPPKPTRDFPRGLAQMVASVEEPVPVDAVEWLSTLGDLTRDDFYYCYRTLRMACVGK